MVIYWYFTENYVRLLAFIILTIFALLILFLNNTKLVISIFFSLASTFTILQHKYGSDQAMHFHLTYILFSLILTSFTSPYFDLAVHENKCPLICSTFKCTLISLHFTLLFMFSSFHRFHFSVWFISSFFGSMPACLLGHQRLLIKLWIWSQRKDP